MVAGVGAENRAIHFLAQNWQTDDGLPQNSVTSIIQSRDGYLWMGTFNGLVRFDGVRFKVFRRTQSNGLPSNRIVRVWEDSKQRLWIATEGGGLSYRTLDGNFVGVRTSEKESSSNIISICEDVEGSVWWTSSHGRVGRFRDGRVEENGAAWGLEWYFCRVIAQDEAGPLSLGTNQGLLVWREGRFRVPLDWQPRITNGVTVLNTIPGGGLVAYSGTQVLELHRGSTTRVLEMGPKSNVSALAQDRKGRIWIGTYGEGIRVQVNPKVPIIIGRNEGLSHEVIRCLFEDREGNIWVGTDGGGLNRLHESAFHTYVPAAGQSGDVILGVAEAEDGSILMGTNGDGLARWNEVEGIKRYGSDQGLTGVHVWSVLKDRRNNVWAGTWGMGLFRGEDLSSKNGLPGEAKNAGENFRTDYLGFKKVPEMEFFGDVVLASYEAPDGMLWFGGHAGLVSWDGKQFKYFSKADGLSNADVRAMVTDKEGALWVATNGGGLNRYHSGRWTQIREKDGLAGDAVWSLHYDSDGVLWVGTFGGGLSRIEDGIIQNFTMEQGLPENVICHINDDDSRHLWLSTYNGICRISKAALKDYQLGDSSELPVFVYGQDAGMPTSECTGGFQPSGAKLFDGRLCFPTVKGLVVIDPRQLPMNALPPSVIIEESLLDGASQLQGSNLAALRVLPDQKRLEFRYTGLSLTAPEKVRFRHRMKGLEDHWIEAGTQRFATYNHLPAGEYVFQVMAANNDGVWTAQPTEIAITIVPAFYKTAWFIVPVFLGSVSMLALTVRMFVLRNYRRRMARLEQMHAIELERSRIAKDIHDDLGASLTQIHLLSELASSDLDQPKVAENHLRKISETARALTRAMDEIVWAVNPQNDTLDALVTYLTKHSHDYLDGANIRCRLDIPTHLPHWPISSDARHHLFMMLKESLNNIVKHAHAHEVWLRLSVGKKSFILLIEDDGGGIPATSQIANGGNRITGGNGLINMRQRMKEMGGSLRVGNRLPHGTVVRMEMEIETLG